MEVDFAFLYNEPDPDGGFNVDFAKILIKDGAQVFDLTMGSPINTKSPFVGQSELFDEHRITPLRTAALCFSDLSAGVKPEPTTPLTLVVRVGDLEDSAFSPKLYIDNVRFSECVTTEVVAEFGLIDTDIVEGEVALLEGEEALRVGQVARFEDTSTGNPTSWHWNFGTLGVDSAQTGSAEQNPEYVYPLAGTYTVTLEVQNGQKRSKKVKTILIGD